MPARKPRPGEKPRSERFMETARAIGADETPEAFEKVFNAVVKPPPQGKAGLCQEERHRTSGGQSEKTPTKAKLSP